jgi:phosphoribosylglycinamide formyltransferase-1
MVARLGVLFSGGGRTVENLAQKIVEGSLDAKIALAISSHEGAGGIARAERFGIPTETLDYRQLQGDLSERICERLAEAEVDWIVLAGFIRYFRFGDRWRERVLNIHPSLLPSFGGKGFYGERVHRAVIESGAKFSGCTVHLVSDEYDRGPIVLQRVIPVLDDDTPENLAARVFAEECIAYPEALRLCLGGRIVVEGSRVRLNLDR